MYPFVLFSVGLGILLSWEHEGAFMWGAGVMLCSFVSFMEQLYWDSETKTRGFMSPSTASALLRHQDKFSGDLKHKLSVLAGKPE